ncbi:hypothetical protein ACHAXM_010509 [Skeletonema potamos]
MMAVVSALLRRWKILTAFIAGIFVQNFLLLVYYVPLSPDVITPSLGKNLKDWKNLHSNVPKDSKSIILNIVVDNIGSCPDNCVFVHKFLPPWLQFRYIVFSNKKNDLSLSRSNNDTDTAQHYHHGLTKAMENNYGHVLVVARYHVVEIAHWAQHYRETHSNKVSVGMFLMGDEELLRHNILVDANLYTNFDYVLRNYFFNATQIGDIPLRFLGNATCGTSLPLPSASGPKWGLHWVFLQPHEPHALLDRPVQSIEPAHTRPKNCTFIGWIGGNRLSKEDRAQVRKLSFRTFSDLHCDVALAGAFGTNKYNHSKLWYLNNDLAQSKIGFNPRGVHPECHRLPEMLKLGTVPAMTEQEYMQYTFEPIPGIVKTSWIEVFSTMRYYLNQKGMNELSALSFKSAMWMDKLEECIKSDMNVVLTGAFGLRPESSSKSKSNTVE